MVALVTGSNDGDGVVGSGTWLAGCAREDVHGQEADQNARDRKSDEEQAQSSVSTGREAQVHQHGRLQGIPVEASWLAGARSQRFSGSHQPGDGLGGFLDLLVGFDAAPHSRVDDAVLEVVIQEAERD